LEEHDNDISVKMEQVTLRKNSHGKISLSVFIVSLQEMPLVNSVVKHRPWRISMVGFWLSDMANFVKDGGATCRPIWRVVGSTKLTQGSRCPRLQEVDKVHTGLSYLIWLELGRRSNCLQVIAKSSN